ncbi:MAG: TIGR00282 family metallophosphoesterase [Alphaproteobacteria bacterium]|nr:TIGR00282 family metallophosphoesterase [Alphaproteobacteria bacterium]
MKFLLLGDVIGRSGREAVKKHLPRLRVEWSLDFVLVNVDNASGGFGVTPKHCDEFLKMGADVLTGGDHVWDQSEIKPYINNAPRMLRPLNFPEGTPGRGTGLYEVKGKKVLVVHALGQVFMRENLDCPFRAVEQVLKGHVLGKTVDAILVDFHAEATSEKNAMGLFLDGKVSAVVGSHTHIPTSDVRVLPNGTAYQTDMGMCGDYNSIIGMQPAGPMEIFLKKMRKVKMTPALGEATLCGLYVETDDATGLAKEVRTVQVGGALDRKVNGN